MAGYDFISHRLKVDGALAAGNRLILAREHANYLLNVLRLSSGDRLLVFNGSDGEWRARLDGGSRKQAEIVIEAQTRPQTAPNDIWYLFAPIKSARLDYMVQKAVEMGASRLMPVMTRRTNVTRVNIDRMRANVIEAAEQCGILAMPAVETELPLAKVLAAWPADRALIFCDEDAPLADPVAALATLLPGKPLAVLIGPEGGFAPEERTVLGDVTPSLRLALGPRILRADTAAVAALTLVQAVLGDFRG